jgi:hypothetical protein
VLKVSSIIFDPSAQLAVFAIFEIGWIIFEKVLFYLKKYNM